MEEWEDAANLMREHADDFTVAMLGSAAANLGKSGVILGRPSAHMCLGMGDQVVSSLMVCNQAIRSFVLLHVSSTRL